MIMMRRVVIPLMSSDICASKVGVGGGAGDGCG